jgi:O-antigen ligase
LVIAAIIGLAFLFYTKSFEEKLILFGLVAISFWALILTYSRSSYLFFVIAFVVLTLIRSKKLLLFGLILALVFATQYPRAIDRIKEATNFEEMDESAELRLASWENSLTVYQDYPIFGIGYNTYRFAQIKYGFIETEKEKILSGAGSDSSLLTILVTAGLLGLISFLLLYFSAIIQAYKSYKKNYSLERKAFSLALFSILIGLFFHSIFVNSLLYPFIMIIFFLLLSIILNTKIPEKY